jgi:hypothetical protein
MIRKSFYLPLATVLCLAAVAPANAALVITEVQATGNNNAYGADWFELTNTGPTALTITNWRMDDGSASFATSVALNGVASIAAGQSVIFFETSNLASTVASFQTTWWGSSPPAGLLFGSYSGGGVGLSDSGDAVNIFDAAGSTLASLVFGASDTTSPKATFDGAGVLAYSVAGVNGAFLSANGQEIGSPGFATAPVPLPAAAWLLLSGLGALGTAARRRRSA